MVQIDRESFLEGEYLDCIKITTSPQKLECHQDIIKISDRVKKIIFDRKIKKNSIINNSDFPRLLEKDVEEFMKEFSISNSRINDSSNQD